MLAVLVPIGFAMAQPLPPAPTPVLPTPQPGATSNVKADPEPLPLPANAPTAVELPSIEAELKRFRDEMREFQSLREEVARSTKSATTEAERASIQERQDLMDLLSKLAKKNADRKSIPPLPPQLDIPPIPEEAIDDTGIGVRVPRASETFDFSRANSEGADASDVTGSLDPADSFALGKVLFRSGDFVGAEKAFRKANVTPENEMTLKYLLATCLRRQSQWKAASEIYKLVSDSNQDPVLRDLAKWQIDNIRWHQQTEMQLDQFRKQREKQGSPKKTSSVSPLRAKR